MNREKKWQGKEHTLKTKMKNLRFQGKELGTSPQVPPEEREDLLARLVQEGTEVTMTHQPKEVTTVSHIVMGNI